MIPSLGPDTLLMFAIGGLLIYLAIAKQYEPTLLLPIGFGVLLGNIPNSPMKSSRLKNAAHGLVWAGDCRAE